MIYIAAHKSFTPPTLDGYVPLQVGASNNEDLGFTRDNTGDNISYKNKTYCELTGAYWIWKNTQDNYKGLVHYRRYFNCSLSMKNIITHQDVNKILNKYDAILPFEMKLKCSVEENYINNCGFDKDIELTRNIIRDKYNDYLDTFDDLWADNKLRLFNMIIAKSNVYDDYCKWLFEILSELEKMTDLSSYDDYQKRIYGFLGERLLNVYFRKNSYKIFQCGVIPTESKWSETKQITTGIKRRLYYIIQM